ncbi:guanine nucleotide exchange factor [Planoprotostelium fungivorum]|uniref:Guanine nucleotide exchange factor n=1 Tax=Planoprotostelium fungivorum TaxID=1890364 RepID=A0A2P6N1T4_9EUKA|nr:guanine nucleotide exchange factor [Planoprotostelium fungivorum]
MSMEVPAPATISEMKQRLTISEFTNLIVYSMFLPRIANLNRKLVNITVRIDQMAADQVTEVLNQIETNHLKMDDYTYNILIDFYCRRREMDEVEKYFHQMKSMNGLTRITFGSLVGMLTATSDEEGVRKTVEHMLSLNIIPGPKLLTSIIRMYNRKRPFDASKGIEYIRYLHSSKGTKTDIYVWTELLNGGTITWHHMKSCVREMLEHHKEAKVDSRFAYVVLVKAAEVGDSDMMEEMLDICKREGVLLDQRVYLTSLLNISKSRNWNYVRQMMQWMDKTLSAWIKPTNECTQAFFASLQHHRIPVKVVDEYMTKLERMHTIDLRLHVAFLRYLIDVKETNEVFMKWFNLLKERNSHNVPNQIWWTERLEKMIQNGSIVHAREVFDSLSDEKKSAINSKRLFGEKIEASAGVCSPSLYERTPAHLYPSTGREKRSSLNRELFVAWEVPKFRSAEAVFSIAEMNACNTLTDVPVGITLWKLAQDKYDAPSLQAINHGGRVILGVVGEDCTTRNLLSRFRAFLTEVSSGQPSCTMVEDIWLPSGDEFVPSMRQLQCQGVPLDDSNIAVFFVDLNNSIRCDSRALVEQMGIAVFNLLLNPTTRIYADPLISGTVLEDDLLYNYTVQNLFAFADGLFSEKTSMGNSVDINGWITQALETQDHPEMVEQTLMNFPAYVTPKVFLTKLVTRFLFWGSFCSPAKYRRVDFEEIKKIARFLSTWTKLYPKDMDHESVMVANRLYLEYYTLSGKAGYTPLLYGAPQVSRTRSASTKNRVEGEAVRRMWDDPTMLAQQLTLLTSKRFLAIDARELLDLNWTKEDATVTAPNVKSIIDMHNTLVNYITFSVVRVEEADNRANIIKQFVITAKTCLKHLDFESVFIISIALSQTSISRLTRTWRRVDDWTKKQWAKIEEFTQGTMNYKNYRSTIKTLVAEGKGPFVPYLGVTLKDLTFIHEVPKYIDGHHVNSDRMRLVHNAIREVTLLKSTEYDFPPNEFYQTILQMDLPQATEKDIYELSKLREPSNVRHSMPVASLTPPLRLDGIDLDLSPRNTSSSSPRNERESPKKSPLAKLSEEEHQEKINKRKSFVGLSSLIKAFSDGSPGHTKTNRKAEK